MLHLLLLVIFLGDFSVQVVDGIRHVVEVNRGSVEVLLGLLGDELMVACRLYVVVGSVQIVVLLWALHNYSWLLNMQGRRASSARRAVISQQDPVRIVGIL